MALPFSSLHFKEECGHALVLFKIKQISGSWVTQNYFSIPKCPATVQQFSEGYCARVHQICKFNSRPALLRVWRSSETAECVPSRTGRVSCHSSATPHGEAALDAHCIHTAEEQSHLASHIVALAAPPRTATWPLKQETAAKRCNGGERAKRLQCIIITHGTTEKRQTLWQDIKANAIQDTATFQWNCYY